MNDLYEALTEQTRLKTLQNAANVGIGRGEGGALTEIVETAKALGLNIPEMSRERDTLVKALEDSRSETQRAEFNHRLEQVDRQFAEVMEEVKGRGGDPLQTALSTAASKLLLDKISGGGGDTMADRLTDRVMRQFEADLDAKQTPQGPTSQLAGAMALIREFQEITAALTPAPAAAPAGLSSEEQLQLDFKRLEIEERIAIHKIDRDTEAAKVKSETLANVVDMLGNGLEFIGKSLGEQMLANQGASPGRVDKTVSGAEPEITEGGAWMACPDCSEKAIFISTEMQEAAAGGEEFQATCTSCHQEHTLGVRQPAASAEDSSDTEDSPDPKNRFSGTGKRLPRFAVGALH